MALIAIAADKGAPGVTTVSVALAAVWPNPALLAECDPAGGDLARWFPAAGGGRLDPGRGLLSLAVAARRGTAADQVLEHTQKLRSGLDVLTGVVTAEQGTGLRLLWGPIGAALAQAPGFDVIADCGRLGADGPRYDLLSYASSVVLVTRDTLAEVTRLRERIAAVAAALALRHRHGVPVRVVVVAAQRRFHAALAEVGQALGPGGTARVIGGIAVDPDGAEALRGGWGEGLSRSPLLRTARDIGGRLAAELAPPAPAASRPTAPPSPAPARATRGQSSSARAAAYGAGPGYPVELATAGLPGPGVLAGLERRRRKQARRRAYGRGAAAVRADAEWPELAPRLGADEAARMLDAGLRYLASALAQEGGAPPAVLAAHVGERNLDLWVSPDGRDAPRPWCAAGDDRVWRLALADAPGLVTALASRTAAPYPGLVPIGTDAAGRVFVDLAAAPGLITVTGPGRLVGEALLAMAAELATSLWSDAIDLTLVGPGAGLVALAPDRVRVVSTLAEALPELEAHAVAVPGAPAASGAGPVLAGRAGGTGPRSRVPHYLITLIPPSEAERKRLLALASAGHAAATGYLVAGEVPGAAWTWELTVDRRLRAPQLGLDVAAQFIPQEQRAAVLDLYERADEPAGEPSAASPAGAALGGHLVPETAGPVEVVLLGPVTVRAPGEVGPSQRVISTEIVVYLATHAGGADRGVLAAAIWPRGVTEATREAALATVQEWLGTDGIGRPHLAADASGRLRLGSGVKVDWHVFLTLAAQARQAGGPAAAPGGNAGLARQQAWEEAKLAQALSLVTGEFLAGKEPGRYAWIVTDGLDHEVSARVGDAAHRLCELRCSGGDPEGALEAVRAGLSLAGDDELLWRDLLTAGQATGQDGLLRAAAGEVWARACAGGPPGMSRQTEALMDELVPDWRWTIA